ncbi:class II aldolase/adducin family protein [Cerasicoccus maritimus]|uniref:class II aldolase/adducin family protein n=1 Tax=Cerasicoccus maritimus TaxID=490089 RepID=UPI002852CFE1|nr:class II aldolase/adducin family protein [Cerasicoccus maritimus]
MKKVFTGKDVEELLASGKGLCAIPDKAVLTPSAKDAIRAAKKSGKGAASAAPSKPAKGLNPIVPDFEFKWKPGTDPVGYEAINAYFNSPELTVIKERMCDMGRRIWAKNYCDGNGGNITVRVGDNLVLCTPTLISKGFIEVDEICMVDLDGNQVAGTRKRTSEVNTHLAIMKATPDAKSCVHAHPIHATAFAIAGVAPPTCLIPEPEVFLGEIALAKYETPGTPENAKAVGALAPEHQSIIMQNHGVITWGKDVEDAYWKMENTEAYCNTIYVASQLGHGLNTYGGNKLKELISIRRSLGMPDRRENMKECELCDNSEFRPGVVCAMPQASAKPSSGDAEDLVQKVTDMIMQQLKG